MHCAGECPHALRRRVPPCTAQESVPECSQKEGLAEPEGGAKDGGAHEAGADEGGAGDSDGSESDGSDDGLQGLLDSLERLKKVAESEFGSEDGALGKAAAGLKGMVRKSKPQESAPPRV